ncbi:MAG TPA: hypothetical protein VFU21_29895 [Kofleriaceae bacterium]|nr:hypothetical protein [Kofleriaceae bacterium]
MRAAIGFSVHTGCAAAVAVGGPRATVLAREHVVLADSDYGRFVYHAARETPAFAREMVKESRQVAERRARKARRGLVAALADHEVVAVALPPARRALPPLDKILASHSLVHSAEGELFRAALVTAAGKVGLAVVEVAAGALPPVKVSGPPWGKDQRTAAALAWGALAATRRGGRGARA